MANNLNLYIKLNAVDKGLNSVLKDAQVRLNQFGTAGKQAGDGINTGLSSARAGVQSISAQLQRVKNELVGLASVAGLVGLAKAFVDTADAVNSLNARLKLATKSTQEYTAAKQGVVDISKRTGQSLESIGTLYAKVADSMRQLGASQKDTLSFTEATAQAMRLSGASASSAEAGITQLSQALASGVLRGDEFNSIMENSPRLAQAMADGLGVPRGALRAMAEEGKLTAAVVTQAILSQGAVLSGEFAQMPVTVGQAFTNLRTSMMLWVEQVDTSTGVTGLFASALDALSKNLDLVMSTVTTLASIAFPALALRAIPAVIAGFAAISAALAPVITEFMFLQGATLAGGIAAVGALKAASLLLFSAWAGWEIGTWARENFEAVRLAGVAMASGLHVAFARLTGASKQEIQAIKDGYFEVFQASTDKARQASAASAAASAAAVAKTKAQLELESAAYKALTATIKANYDQRLADLSANLQQQLALIDASGSNETVKEAAKTAAIVAAHNERMAAIKTYQAEILKLIDDEKQARLAASKSSGETEKQINLEAMNAKRATLADILKAYQAHFADLAGQYNAHLAHVRQIEQAKRDAVAGVEATLRDMARETMTERQAYSDKQKEVEELQSATRKALAEGDYAHAQEYANKSIALAKSMANEVKDGDQVVIDKRTAVGEATRQVKESLDLMKQAYDGQGESAKKEAEATKSAMAETKSGVDSLKIAIGELDSALAGQHALTVKHNVDEVKAAINSLNGQNTSSTHTIIVKKVEAHSAGGLVGISHFAMGGPVLPTLSQRVQRFATGGPVFKRQNWLKVPGSGNGDTVPAQLDAGSFVVKKAASAYYGDGIMGRIAAGVQKFATGGIVSEGADDNDELTEINKLMAELGGIMAEMNAHGRAYSIGSGFDSSSTDYRKTLGKFGIKSPLKASDLPKMKEALDYWRNYYANMKNYESMVSPGGTSRGSALSNDVFGARGFSTGGPSGSDTVPAWLTPEEFVVKPAAAKKYGFGFLDDLNNMRIPKSALAGIGAPPVARFATGGPVGRSAPLTSSPSSDSRTVTIRFAAPSGSAVSGTFSQNDAGKMLAILKQAGARTL